MDPVLRTLSIGLIAVFAVSCDLHPDRDIPFKTSAGEKLVRPSFLTECNHGLNAKGYSINDHERANACRILSASTLGSREAIDFIMDGCALDARYCNDYLNAIYYANESEPLTEPEAAAIKTFLGQTCSGRVRSSYENICLVQVPDLLEGKHRHHVGAIEDSALAGQIIKSQCESVDYTFSDACRRAQKEGIDAAPLSGERVAAARQQRAESERWDALGKSIHDAEFMARWGHAVGEHTLAACDENQAQCLTQCSHFPISSLDQCKLQCGSSRLSCTR
jgi:hypothetical protein